MFGKGERRGFFEGIKVMDFAPGLGGHRETTEKKRGRGKEGTFGIFGQFKV